MEFGFTSMGTPEELRPDTLAKVLEERGYESLFIGEHSHIPCSRITPYPAGGEMPAPYKQMMDPFVNLTVAAMAAPSIKVATSVALPLEHHILGLAKAVSTIDYLTGGRFLFGVGVGWNEEELANHSSVPWRQRYRALADAVAALKVLWTEDEAEYHGPFFDFDPVWSYPKPVQSPHPPILCGMSGRLGTDHAIAWADGWMPMDVGLGNVPKKLAKFRAMAEEAGRDPSSIEISMVTWGNPTFETLASYKELGCARVVLGAAREGWTDPTGTMPFIDTYAEMIRQLQD